LEIRSFFKQKSGVYQEILLKKSGEKAGDFFQVEEILWGFFSQKIRILAHTGAFGS
jgi:hypothetical protein